MDGSNASFLLDMPLVSANTRPAARGILYFEDFDGGRETPLAPEAPLQAEPVLTLDDVEAARAQGREDGLQSALADAQTLHDQLHLAALQSVADGLSAARATLESVAERHADEIASMLFAILHAAIPATMQTHADCERNAVIKALLPGLKSAPELRVRAHPDSADSVRDALASNLPAEACVLCVCTDPQLGVADVQINWQDGYATRNATGIWAEITSALAPLKLPTHQEITCGQ